MGCGLKLHTRASFLSYLPVYQITGPSDLTVLMSGIRQGEPVDAGNGKKLHKFHQKIPIQVPML
jgi:hypothetical protein